MTLNTRVFHNRETHQGINVNQIATNLAASSIGAAAHLVQPENSFSVKYQGPKSEEVVLGSCRLISKAA